MSVGMAPTSTPAPASAPAFHAYTAFRRFSVAEYHQLIRIGVLTDEDKVELLRGYVVYKMPRNPPHDSRIQKLNRLLVGLLPAGWDIRVQLAITLSESEPEPDLAVVRGAADDYDAAHPGPTDSGLVVEVADTSLIRDRDDKGPIYAEAGIPIYWIVNIQDRWVEVYTQPTGTGTAARYAQRQDYRPGDSVPVVLGGAVVGQVAVLDILP